MARKPTEPLIEPHEFASVEEIDRGIAKLNRRIADIEALDVEAAALEHTGEDKAVEENIRESIREVFGSNSPEFHEHQYITIYAGPRWMGMSEESVIEGKQHGKKQVTGVLNGLIGRLRESVKNSRRGSRPNPRHIFVS